jgi:hypothetical protein
MGVNQFERGYTPAMDSPSQEGLGEPGARHINLIQMGVIDDRENTFGVFLVC